MASRLAAIGRPAKWRALADRIDALADLTTEGSIFARLSNGVAALERLAADHRNRVHRRHAATGMATREPLLLKMRQDGQGVLGVIRFLDFDRLCAFDPALGDHLLIAVAERLSEMLPRQRILAHVDRAHLAIWFGPDFTVASARTEMEAIEYALGDAVLVGDRTILPKASSQLAVLAGEDPAVVLARTLAQLTIATSPSMTSAVETKDSGSTEREGFSLEQDLRQALMRGELRLHYQPLIDAAKACVCGAEALIRWHNPERGLVSPTIFVPVMEATGLAHEFGMWALNAAARDAHGWQAFGHDLRVAVNVSGHQLDREDLSALIERTLTRHDLPARALEIELTEGAVVDGERAQRLFSKIRAMGVTIAIDDFGTGFSSLSTLRKLAFDKIKIDREFVTDVDSRKDSQAICQSMIALARGLGIRILAEGVERPEEYRWLRRHGCNFFQGYYFSTPLAPADFVAFIENPADLAGKLALDPRAMQQHISQRLSA